MAKTGMTIDEFGQEIKKKYPQYQNVPDAELGEQVLKKYPQYQRALSADRPSSVSPAEVAERPSAPQAPTQPKNNLLTSLSKPFLRTATNVLNVAEGVGKLASGQAVGDSATRSRDFGAFGRNIRPVGVSEDGQMKGIGGFAKDVVGTGLEIGSYAAPAGILGKGAPLASKITTGIKAGAGSGALGSFGSGLQAEQSFGKTLGDTVKGGILGGTTGGALPLVGTAIRKAGNFAGSLAGEALGRTTGTGANAVTAPFYDKEVIGFARRAGKEGPEGLLKEALGEAKQGLDLMTGANSAAYREAIGKIKASPKDMSQAVSNIRSLIVNEARDNFGVRFVDGKKLKNLDFNASDVVEGTSSVQRAFDRFFSEPINTVADLDRVKKSLGRLANGAPARSPAQALIYKMKDAVSTALKTDIPGYATEMARYSDAADISDEIQKALSLGDNAAQDTAIRKLTSSMRQNNELRREMLQTLGSKSGDNPLAKIAGVALSPKLPRGLVGALTPTLGSLGIATSILSPQQIPYILLILATTSPRLVAEAVNLIGKIKGKTIPLPIQKGLKNLLLQAARENVTSDSEKAPQAAN